MDLAGDTRPRASVGWTARLERVQTVNLSGFRRQHRVETFVARRLWKAEISNAWHSVRIQLSSVDSKSVRQGSHPSTANLYRLTILDLLSRINPPTVLKANGSTSSTPCTTTRSTSQVRILRSADGHAWRSARIVFRWALTKEVRLFWDDMKRIVCVRHFSGPRVIYADFSSFGVYKANLWVFLWIDDEFWTLLQFWSNGMLNNKNFDFNGKATLIISEHENNFFR